MLNKQKGMTNTPRNRLQNALLILNCLNANEKGTKVAYDRKNFRIISSNVLQGCVDLRMKARKCDTLGNGFHSSFYRRKKAIDIKINQDLV